MDEAHYKLLRLIQSRPDASQRELAHALGMSLGKVNYCVNALIEKGWVKARHFRNSQNKFAYAYLLTPRGMEQKATITLHFLQRKVEEYESLKREIADLRREVSGNGGSTRPTKGRLGGMEAAMNVVDAELHLGAAGLPAPWFVGFTKPREDGS